MVRTNKQKKKKKREHFLIVRRALSTKNEVRPMHAPINFPSCRPACKSRPEDESKKKCRMARHLSCQRCLYMIPVHALNPFAFVHYELGSTCGPRLPLQSTWVFALLYKRKGEGEGGAERKRKKINDHSAITFSPLLDNHLCLSINTTNAAISSSFSPYPPLSTLQAHIISLFFFPSFSLSSSSITQARQRPSDSPTNITAPLDSHIIPPTWRPVHISKSSLSVLVSAD